MKQKKSTQVKSKQNHSTISSNLYNVIPTTNFTKEALKLKKKYPNIKDDFLCLAAELKKDPITGNDFIAKNCYKVRMGISDKGSGDRGGARVIIEVKIIDKVVYVLSVYDKANKSDLFDKELDKILEKKLDKY